MKFTTATALFFAGLVAAETVSVTDLTIRDNNGLQSVSFKVAGTDCSSTDAASLANNGANACGDGNPPVFTYSVEKTEGSEYQLYLHKNVDGSVRGLNGGAKAPVNCRAGGNGASDNVCQQTGDFSVDLQ
ncbi:major allergen alt [Diplodia corticola]|uniref:Major allergen alt n=1 Tax=Diplodia corticola TaxID=236234 RepID=A0A1J9RXR7_9PEZI|nr:major allergen alt [Diplodia corticola]OJD33159.1 major allergen alt [Diplodia corticola]